MTFRAAWRQACLLTPIFCFSLAMARAVVAAPAATSAAMSAAPNLTAVTAAVRASSRNGGMTAVSKFAGPSGLVGAVVQAANGERRVVWLTPDLKTVIPGAIYDVHGTDLTQKAMYSEGVYLSAAAALAEASAPSARAFIAGRSGPVLTFFLDPNCIFCHELYEALKAPVRDGKLRVRYVMVGVVKADSAARAAAILSSRDPLAALATDEGAFDVAHEEGGIAYPNTPDASALTAVQANSRLMLHTGSVGTPTLLYCSAKSETAVMEPGVPKDIPAWIVHIGLDGAPACSR